MPGRSADAVAPARAVSARDAETAGRSRQRRRWSRRGSSWRPPPPRPDRRRRRDDRNRRSSAYSITRDGRTSGAAGDPLRAVDRHGEARRRDVMWLFPTSDEIEWTVAARGVLRLGDLDRGHRRLSREAALHPRPPRRGGEGALHPGRAAAVQRARRDASVPGDRGRRASPGFKPGERIGFWWRADDAVTVLIAPGRPTDALTERAATATIVSVWSRSRICWPSRSRLSC